MDTEEGSVESALVLIPTTAFFLLVMQLIVAGSWQTLQGAKLDDLVNRIKIEQGDEGRFAFALKDEGVQVQSSDLPDGSRLLVVKRRVAIPILSNLVGNDAHVTTVALAID